uniref:Uncharacterized protein n=1 Tax=Arundo donax TaxID=35708 RepID=A0A0A9B654_ARUDO
MAAPRQEGFQAN